MHVEKTEPTSTLTWVITPTHSSWSTDMFPSHHLIVNPVGSCGPGYRFNCGLSLTRWPAGCGRWLGDHLARGAVPVVTQAVSNHHVVLRVGRAPRHLYGGDRTWDDNVRYITEQQMGSQITLICIFTSNSINTLSDSSIPFFLYIPNTIYKKMAHRFYGMHSQVLLCLEKSVPPSSI